MRKRKIFFHIHTLTRGGAERSVINLAKQFTEVGYDVTIVTSIKCDVEYEVAGSVKRFILSNKDNTSLSNPITRMFILGLELRRIIKKEKPDVIIAFISGSVVRSVIATIGLPIKVIASIRNDPKYEYRGITGNWIIKCILPHVDGFVFQTKQAKEYFNDSIQKKSTIIMNSVDPIFYLVKRKPIKNRIVTCGRLDLQKNQKLLINAFAEVRKVITDAELLIYGKGPEEGNLKQQIKELALEDSCFLKGETSDVPEVMSKADIFILSSNFEGMPNVLIEALTAGVPCISTDCPCGGPRYIIDSWKNGILVKVNDKQELIDSIIYLSTDRELMNSISVNARKVSERFRPEIIYSEWSKFIERICK